MTQRARTGSSCAGAPDGVLLATRRDLTSALPCIRALAGITPTMIWDALQAPEILAAVLTVPCVAGCALFSGSIRGRVPSWLPFAGTLLSAAALPAAITLYVRRAMDSYINQSLGSDLADIEANYESQGSAFWVADVPGSSVVGILVQASTGPHRARHTTHARTCEARQANRHQGTGVRRRAGRPCEARQTYGACRASQVSVRSPNALCGRRWCTHRLGWWRLCTTVAQRRN